MNPHVSLDPPVVLAVAGTDSGGAAGLAADLATIGHLGAHAACVVTAVTAQDTTGVQAVHAVPGEVVAAQLESVLGDLPVAAVKTGMLGTPEAVSLVASRLGHLPLVVDPVLVATSGAVLGDEAVLAAYRSVLSPTARVITPNLDEARALTGVEGAPADIAARLAERGCAALVTGVPGETAWTDWLALPGETPMALSHARVETANDHGTGCTHSSALATLLARGLPLAEAAVGAASYVASRLEASRGWSLGRGRGPVAHVAPSVVVPAG